MSAAGIFWILKSLQGEAEERPPEPETQEDTLAQRIGRIEDTLSKLERKIGEQNADQMNEMAGQMKLIVQMLKTLGSAEGGGGDPVLQQKVDKIYQILSTLSRTETK